MSQQVEIGGDVYTIQPFSPRKVLIATAAVSRAGGTFRQVAGEVARFTREYREENADVITRSMAAVPPYSNSDVIRSMTAEDWDKAAGQIEIRRDPTVYEQVGVALPLAFDTAEKEVSKLLALLLIPNEELARAAKAGEADAALVEWADKVLDGGDIGGLIDLVDVALGVFREELAGKAKVVDRIRQSVRGLLGLPPTESLEGEDLPEDGSTKKSPSSTSSDEPMDGTTSPASTGSPQGSLSPSPVA